MDELIDRATIVEAISGADFRPLGRPSVRRRLIQSTLLPHKSLDMDAKEDASDEFYVMAYRRRQGITRASTFKEEIYHPPDASTSAPSASLAAQAIRASAAHRDSSLSSAYGDSAFHSSFNYRSKESSADDYTSMGSINEPGGFWGVLARKAKAILEDDDATQQSETSTVRNQHTTDASPNSQFYYQYQSNESGGKMDNPRLRKGLDALTTSLNHIGDTIGNALEEGRSIVENRTADIIQETRKLQIRRKGINDEEQGFSVHNQWQESLTQPTQAQIQVNHENQIKASRDVAMATAAKAKLLLRELKTVKADLAFAKQRSSQLEEENKMLREAKEKGVNPADDDMIRLQLETLLAEKARLAHENSIYARENRFLREIVEYHQLTMQDVVYLDEGIEEVTEICPVPGMARMLSVSPPSPSSPCSIADFSPSATATPRILKKETSTIPEVSPSASTLINKETEAADVPKSEAQTSSTTTSSHSTTEALTRS